MLTPLVVTNQTLFPFVVGRHFMLRALIGVAVGLWLVLAPHVPGLSSATVMGVVQRLASTSFVALLAGVFGVSLQRSLPSTYERMQGLVDLAHWVAFCSRAVLSLYPSNRCQTGAHSSMRQPSGVIR